MAALGTTNGVIQATTVMIALVRRFGRRLPRMLERLGVVGVLG